MNYKTTEKQRNIVLKRYYEKQKDLALYKTSSKYYKDYTSEEDKLIMADNGMTMLDKARKLGRSYASVKGRRQRLLAIENGEYTKTWRKLHA